MKKLSLTFFAAALCVFAFLPVTAAAQTATAHLTVSKSFCDNTFLTSIGMIDENGSSAGSLIPCNCIVAGQCGLPEMFATIINFSQLILGMTGSLALLMIVYGGAMFIIAAGNQDRIQKAKQILTAAAIGVVIILSAWLVVNFIIGSLTGGEIHSQATIFDRVWSEAPNGE